MLDFEPQIYVERFGYNFPQIVPAGDYMLYAGLVDKLNNRTLIVNKFYFTVRRRIGSRSKSSFDFMNLEWKIPTLNYTYKINDEKVENYTSILT